MVKKKVKKMEELQANEPTSISATPLKDLDPVKPECLTDEELQTIMNAQNKAVHLTEMAEKKVAEMKIAVSEARVAELEAQNIILLTYNKYQLNQSIGDSITKNGLINRVRENKEDNGQ
jgi:hypothetical protein